VRAPHGPEAIHAAYLDASRLLAVVAAPPRRPGVVTANDLFAHRALTSLPPDMLDELMSQVVNPFLALPDKERGRAVDTLLAYYGEGCNATRAAEVLQIMRRTVTDRLEKVERVTGLSPD